MAIISSLSTLHSCLIRKKFGSPNSYGGIFFGVSGFGDENDLAGIYRVREIDGREQNERLPFYYPSNPRTEIQQSNRNNFSNAIAAWQSLTSEEKDIWRVAAQRKPMSGYNWFIHSYLLDV